MVKKSWKIPSSGFFFAIKSEHVYRRDAPWHASTKIIMQAESYSGIFM